MLELFDSVVERVLLDMRLVSDFFSILDFDSFHMMLSSCSITVPIPLLDVQWFTTIIKLEFHIIGDM